MSSSEILQELRSFRQMGRALYIAAHPDDENTHLIAYLARGRGFDTGYLSLTRGQGGQNLIGPELGDALGVLRTQELLAARRIDGGVQFFTRAKDFGFSKDYHEALSIWDHQLILSDIVRTIRAFRPDVLITRFPPESSGTHGHHTASAFLAVEAFKLAGDPDAFPEQLDTYPPWQPKRILFNYFGGMGQTSSSSPDLLRLDVGGFQPLFGESFGEIAARSRSMHKSQGFGSVANRGERYESFRLLDGSPVTGDLFDGIDTTWSRVPGGAEIGHMVEEVITGFNPRDPSASVPALLQIRRELAELPEDPMITDKRGQLDRIIMASLGLYVETSVPQAEIVPGEDLPLQHSVVIRTDYPVRWLSLYYPDVEGQVDVGVDLKMNRLAVEEATQPIPAETPVSQPYWLRDEGGTGAYHVEDETLLGHPENPPAFPVNFVFEVNDQIITVVDEPVQIVRDPVEGEIRFPLRIIPPVSLNFVQDLELLNPGAERPVTVDVTASRSDVTGMVSLEAPVGWQVTPETHPFYLENKGDRIALTFTLTAPESSSDVEIVAKASVEGKNFDNQRVEFDYEHIPGILLQPPAKLKAISLDLNVLGQTVGYIAGAGDHVDESLVRMGYTVSHLSEIDFTPERLRDFDAIVLGIRAFNTRTDLESRLPLLFDYVEKGGTLIIQYNTTSGLLTERLTPFDLRLSRERITDENAPVTFLATEHPVLHTPNRITPEDFEGWIQERGLYFPVHWDNRFVPILASNDPGESPLTGGLLVARHGEGYIVYTSYSWFRQLPEGIPGAYRIFANLVSLGK